jgi:hypothetical protein
MASKKKVRPKPSPIQKAWKTLVVELEKAGALPLVEKPLIDVWAKIHPLIAREALSPDEYAGLILSRLQDFRGWLKGTEGDPAKHAEARSLIATDDLVTLEAVERWRGKVPPPNRSTRLGAKRTGEKNYDWKLVVVELLAKRFPDHKPDSLRKAVDRATKSDK